MLSLARSRVGPIVLLQGSSDLLRDNLIGCRSLVRIERWLFGSGISLAGSARHIRPSTRRARGLPRDDRRDLLEGIAENLRRVEA